MEKLDFIRIASNSIAITMCIVAAVASFFTSSILIGILFLLLGASSLTNLIGVYKELVEKK